MTDSTSLKRRGQRAELSDRTRHETREADRRLRAHPPEPMTREQRRRMERIDSIARVLDSAVLIPGTSWRVGADSLMGLVPGIGDMASAAVSSWLIREAWLGGARKRAIARMLANVAIDGTVGSVPLLGDIFDVAFKANRRNAEIAREELSRAPEPRKKFISV